MKRICDCLVGIFLLAIYCYLFIAIYYFAKISRWSFYAYDRSAPGTSHELSSVAPFSVVLLFEPILIILRLLNLMLGRGGALPLALSPVLVVGPLGRRWSGSRAAWPPSPCMRYPTRVRVLLSLPFCSLAKEADSLVFLWFALNIVSRIAEGVSIFHLWRAAGSSCVAPTPDKAPARAAPCPCPPCFFKFAI